MPLPAPSFVGLTDDKPLTIYWRNLPHWRQEGALYFVTFRLGDSIPAAILRMWADERDAWLRAMGIVPEWKRADPERYEQALAALPDQAVREFQSRRARKEHLELDRCHGSCLFRDGATSQVLADALRFFNGERWWLGDFVIMPNHVHLLALPGKDTPLEEILGSVKKFAARRLPVPERTKELPVWQQESFDRIVRDRAELIAYRRYIAANPSKARLGPGQFVLHHASWLDEWATPHVA